MELRVSLRDRRTLTVLFLFPLVGYPLVSLLMAEVMAGKQATDDARVPHVALVDPDASTRATLVALLEKKGNGIEVTRDVSLLHATGADGSNGLIDAVIDVPPGKIDKGPQPVRIIYDETRPVSDQAHDRAAKTLSGVLPNGCFQTYAVTGSSLATKAKVGGYVLSKILPLIVVIMTMLGAFYPAIDITAGERERGTLETLLSSPVQRFDLMTGKVLAVACLSLLTGVLNIVSMSLTVAEGAKLAAGTPILAIPWPRAAATLLIVVPAAFLFGSVMVAMGAMARSFKEAQALLMPVYLLCFTPSLVAGMADFKLAGLTMLVHGTNLTLQVRDLMLNSQWGGCLGLVWIYARLCRRPLGDVLVFRRPRPAALLGAVCVGLSGWIILGILAA